VVADDRLLGSVEPQKPVGMSQAGRQHSGPHIAEQAAPYTFNEPDLVWDNHLFIFLLLVQRSDFFLSLRRGNGALLRHWSAGLSWSTRREEGVLLEVSFPE